MQQQNSDKKLSIKLTHCYGIESLDCELDFSESNTVIIYASNGIMKTSFARTFDRLSQGKEPEELIYGYDSQYEVIYHSQPISKDQIYVIKDFKPDIFKDELISKLVVDEKSKNKYDAIYSDIASKRRSMILKLTKLSGIPQSNLEDELKHIFQFKDFNEFVCQLNFENLFELKLDYKYSDIFNSDVIPILKEDDIQSVILEYNKEMNRIISEIVLFNKAGEFNLTKAENVAKTLIKEMFFKAGHTIILSGSEGKIGEKEYKELLDRANNEIKKSEKLKELRQRLLKKNSLKNFADLIEKNPAIIQELEDRIKFQKKIFESYFKLIEVELSEYSILYNESIETLKEIEEYARNQQTKWKSIVEQFKSRFSTPYDDIDILDKPSIILGKTTTPQIIFKFSDKEIYKEDLFKKNTLSEGEGRAYSLLNILYEIETRRDSEKLQFIIVDDLADSFDYKNKYAILQYLKDLSKLSNFRLIVLTHNFDFFRSAVGRINQGKNSFIAERLDGKLKLHKATDGILHPFTSWKSNIASNIDIAIVMIPFVRNLIEYTKGSQSHGYVTLTKLLHSKQDSQNITFNQLENAYQEVMPNITFGFTENKNVQAYIIDCAEKIKVLNDKFLLKEKIVLSIAIRILSENYMWSNVTEKSDRDTVSEGKLLERYKEEYKDDLKHEKAINTLEEVNIMTPENIHLNSFMFEPIIDMGLGHLKALFTKVKML